MRFESTTARRAGTQVAGAVTCTTALFNVLEFPHAHAPRREAQAAPAKHRLRGSKIACRKCGRWTALAVLTDNRSTE
jgi:nicotinic acid mononucleotide adenylyltransferase